MGNGGHDILLQMHFDLGFPLFQVKLVYVSKAPQPILSFGNISKPFSTTVWLCIVGLLLGLSFLFLATYKIYENISALHVTRETSIINFFLFTFCKLTEPDPITWFQNGVSASVSVALWRLLCLFSLMFYLSNLRAVLVTVQYEDPIDTLQDVVKHGRRVWINNGIFGHRFDEFFCLYTVKVKFLIWFKI